MSAVPSPIVGPTIRFKAIAELKLYERNSRTHSAEQILQLQASMVEFGWTMPVLEDAQGVVAGHARIAAAAALYAEFGLSLNFPDGSEIPFGMVPVLACDGWSQAKRRAYVIADNKLALNAGWDNEMLAVEFQSLLDADFDLSLLGFAGDEVRSILPSGGLTDEDAVPAVESETTSRLGDVWILGVHRLLCGDSTSSADVQAFMSDGLADACWTDPPYNVDYQANAGKIQNDNMSAENFRALLAGAFNAAWSVMKAGAPIYVAHADTEGLNFRTAFCNASFKLAGSLVWVKNHFVFGRSDYQWQHEPILYGWKPGSAHRWYGARNKTTVFKSEDEGSVFTRNANGSITVRVGDQSVVISGKNIVARPVDSTVIRCERPMRSLDHPTMKPVELISKMLRNSTREGDVVIDLFGGSGSTLIACETLGRQARLVELEGRFCDVIVRRWQEFTGSIAYLSANDRSFEQTRFDRTST